MIPDRRATVANAALDPDAPAALASTSATTTYHRVDVDGVDVFFREAGSPEAPAVVLLHGFPSSSRMYEGLIPLLATQYHVIAPDYPGFGHSEAPSPERYPYTFDQLARTIGRLLDQLGVERCAFYLQDYGGPVGFRVMMAKPERVGALIVQNANAYAEGLGPKWSGIAKYWQDPARHLDQFEAFVSLDGARQRHLAGSPRPERYSPDSWADEHAMLSRPGARAIQAALLLDYRSNVAAYPEWQAWLRRERPATMVLWGRYDPSFLVPGAEAYRRDLPDAELHLLDAGHFALDEQLDRAAALILDFLGRRLR